MDLTQIGVRISSNEDQRELQQFCVLPLSEEVGEIRPENGNDLFASQIQFLGHHGVHLIITDENTDIVGVVVMQPLQRNDMGYAQVTRFRMSEDLMIALSESLDSQTVHGFLDVFITCMPQACRGFKCKIDLHSDLGQVLFTTLEHHGHGVSVSTGQNNLIALFSNTKPD